MIDLHSHFLPGIDDGAKDRKDSLRMLAEAFRQGVMLCAGTPHAIVHTNEEINVFLHKRQQSIDVLLNGPMPETVPNLIYGAEIFLDNDISQYPDIKKLCIGNSNLLLVELSTQKYNPEYAEWLYSLSLVGIVPIIAHIERYPYFEELSAELGDINIVFQMNCKTVLDRGWRKYLLEQRMSGADCLVSSDMHDMRLRKCCMKKAFDKVNKRNTHIAEELFGGAAKGLLQSN